MTFYRLFSVLFFYDSSNREEKNYLQIICWKAVSGFWFFTDHMASKIFQFLKKLENFYYNYVFKTTFGADCLLRLFSMFWKFPDLFATVAQTERNLKSLHFNYYSAQNCFHLFRLSSKSSQPRNRTPKILPFSTDKKEFKHIFVTF